MLLFVLERFYTKRKMFIFIPKFGSAPERQRSESEPERWVRMGPAGISPPQSVLLGSVLGSNHGEAVTDLQKSLGTLTNRTSFCLKHTLLDRTGF